MLRSGSFLFSLDCANMEPFLFSCTTCVDPQVRQCVQFRHSRTHTRARGDRGGTGFLCSSKSTGGNPPLFFPAPLVKPISLPKKGRYFFSQKKIVNATSTLVATKTPYLSFISCSAVRERRIAHHYFSILIHYHCRRINFESGRALTILSVLLLAFLFVLVTCCSSNLRRWRI